MRRLPLPLLLPLLLVACRDPAAGPPPRTLTPAQVAEVRRHTLAAAPEPTLRPPGGAVSLGEGRVRYLGSDVSPTPLVPGEPATLTHYWEAVGPLDHDWQIFVHLGSPGRGRPRLTADHHPIGGLWPTSRWRPGDRYADVHTVTVPEDWPGRDAELWIGLFRLDRRLPVDGGRGRQDRIRVGRIPVAPDLSGLPEYRAPRASAPPTLDGRLDDDAWATAPVVALSRSDGSGAPRHRTRARLAWDEAHLYVAFESEDDDVFSSFDRDDAPLYEEEVVEIFIDADGDGRTYDELQVAPSGHVFDARFRARRRGMDLAWDSGLRAGVRVDGTLNQPGDRDRGWTAELAIPVDRLSAVPRWPPGPGDRWRFNLYRLEHPDRSGVEGSAFSPPRVPDFHHLPRFGRLSFGGASSPRSADDRR